MERIDRCQNITAAYSPTVGNDKVDERQSELFFIFTVYSVTKLHFSIIKPKNQCLDEWEMTV